uniref:Glycosyltransferase involved in cell wall bisynthesis n=1 Tax=Candidatus Kentrum sp. LPFa TaxID=2126335 RepID=A0A450XDD0_9GAMM|nr:MAG: Glycosyltransferase involved in cell wall bisynthesis [Candidatus Kentron sp. LPFa]VFK27303.1 MAG: Glycosyltransferase involved in cell wall bisynthesis [Candidatus Kentron sp. LPFa]
MRIIIDMQGAQTESRFRGIGRYALSLAKAIAHNRGRHDVFLALNGLFPDTIEPLRAAFDNLLPQDNIRVWHAPGPVREQQPGNDTRREVAELVREAFLASLRPDVVHISSLFEGYVDDGVTSIGCFDRKTPVSVSFYDLIPLVNPEQYFKLDPRYARYYRRKVQYLKQAAQLLAISESTRREGLAYLEMPADRVVNISSAIDPHFHPIGINADADAQLRRKYAITSPFVLYVGSADERKNLTRLMGAYAALSVSLRAKHQLVLVGKMPEQTVAELKHLAKTAHGIEPNELCFTGYVSDEELIRLCNSCELFVFPSLHEGFGLPALEAMACGAPVIGANTSSLPEVIGLEEALFDPLDVAAITTKMASALQDEVFCTRLREHGLRQAKKFSWDNTAKRAIAAWEGLPPQEVGGHYLETSLAGQRLIQVIAQRTSSPQSSELCPLSACLAQNRQAGIERQLFLDVSELCQRDAASGVQRVVRSYLKWLLQSPPVGFRVEPVYATRDEGYRYARRFTRHFLARNVQNVVDDPMEWQRGDIFFGLDMQHHVQLAHAAFYRQLRLDGITVKFLIHDLLPIQLSDSFKDANAKKLHEQWLSMIAAGDGAICVSKATADAFKGWIAENPVPRIPPFRIGWVHNGGDIDGSQPSQGLPTDAEGVLTALHNRPSFLCVATLEPRKRQQQIVDACELLWGEGLEFNLVLVGQQGWKIDGFAGGIRNHLENGKRLFWLEGISDEYLAKVYGASTCLIAASLDEGFGLPLIEAARYGLPIIARDIPVFREVAGDCAFYFTGETPRDLAAALKTWLGLHREERHPKSTQLRWSTWRESAEKLKVALTQENYPRRQLLVDISELAQRDARSGIQRVVRSILKEWLHHPPAGYRIEPIYATVDQPYRYARRFTARFLGIETDTPSDEIIDYAPGDIFFGLDLEPQIQTAKRAFYQDLRRQGVKVKFLVHDLLSIRMPHCFPVGTAENFTQWLQVVAESDGAVCVSKTTTDDLAAWVRTNKPSRQCPFEIDWSHNGADFGSSTQTEGLPFDVDTVPERFRDHPSFLMVGTLDPRKGHAQVLEAFGHLWKAGFDINLVIVGKQGWMVENLVKSLCAHTECNKRLFWLEAISDEYLDKVYAASTCLIAASYGEGFGLPLIEAAQHKLPIIVRDISVFREVGGEHAYYFSAQTSDHLAEAIRAWLALFKEDRHPKSAEMPWRTWKESARRLMDLLIGEHIDTGEKHAKAL